MNVVANYIDYLIDNLVVLSSTAEEQIEYLSKIGHAEVDELALEYHDLIILAPSMRDAGRLSELQLQALSKISSKLQDMSGSSNELFWTHESLRDSPAWDEVRILARDALTAIEGL
jgi:hypothetical protein